MRKTVAPTHLLRVFEHQRISVGETINGNIFSRTQFHALARYLGKHGGKYYSLLHDGVKFSHYVGAIQIGKMTIEILPKADKKEQADTQQWHDVLMAMLKECRLLKVETLASARLQLRTNSILELYFEIFASEIEKLLKRGLFRQYQKSEGNHQYLRGKLIFHKNITINFAHEERFYTENEKYDYDHLLNRILRRSLEVIESLVLSPNLLTKIKKLKEHFPPSRKEIFTERDFRKLVNDRKTQPYRSALDIAKLLILNYSPDLRGGKHHLLAILFDMNLLFEEYVYRKLKRMENENVSVKRQQQKPFFQRRKIQPDILVKYFGKNYVLDTKWKVLKKAHPSMPDLRQSYIYNKYFNSERCLLLYPKVYQVNDLPPTPYHPSKEFPYSDETKDQIMFCQVCFLKIIIHGELNQDLGIDIMEKIQDP